MKNSFKILLLAITIGLTVQSCTPGTINNSSESAITDPNKQDINPPIGGPQ